MKKVIELQKRLDPITGNYTNYYTEGHPHLEKSWCKSINDQFAEGRVVYGIYRWNSNNRIPFEDMLADFVNHGLITKEVFMKSRMEQIRQNDRLFRLNEEAIKDIIFN